MIEYSAVDKEYSECLNNESPASCSGRSFASSLGYCQAGFSASFSLGGNALVIGAPGAQGWHGAIFAYDLHAGNLIAERSSYNPQHADNYDYLRSFQYLGYSVAFAELNDDRDYEEIVASAPKYSHASLTGLVYVFERLKSESSTKVYQIGSESDPNYPLRGSQAGSYFGYKTISFDMNGDQ